MDNGSWWIWGLLLLVMGLLFMWVIPLLKDSGTERGRWSALKKRILGWVHAVDQEEFITLRQQFELHRSEMSDRIDRLELTLTQQGRLENWTTEVNGRLCQLELSKESPQTKSAPRQVNTKSILCLGVRVTLTSKIWDGLGKAPQEDLSDLQIRQYIQGPFCRNCLRSLVVDGEADDDKSVRAQCRYCSLIWRKDSRTPLPLSQVKREIYDYLDTAYRNGENGEPPSFMPKS